MQSCAILYQVSKRVLYGVMPSHAVILLVQYIHVTSHYDTEHIDYKYGDSKPRVNNDSTLVAMQYNRSGLLTLTLLIANNRN